MIKEKKTGLLKKSEKKFVQAGAIGGVGCLWMSLGCNCNRFICNELQENNTCVLGQRVV
jgi:hypothetical protein